MSQYATVLPPQKHPVKCALRFIVSSFYNVWWLYVIHSLSLTICAGGASKAAFVRHSHFRALFRQIIGLKDRRRYRAEAWPLPLGHMFGICNWLSEKRLRGQTPRLCRNLCVFSIMSVSSTATCPQAQVRTVFFPLICVASATPFIHLVAFMPVQVQTRLQLSRRLRAPM